jgi:thiosulfate/3-mercaptopyruvate sulfurtransferase
MKPSDRRFHLKNAVFLIGLIAFLVLSNGCQQAPTKITEAAPAPFTRLTEKTLKPLKLTDDTVVLDARSEFDYGLGHWSHSIHFTWEKLMNEKKSLVPPRTAAQRLALLGIEPQTPVVVIGYGLKGQGDEGRLAWTLNYYGVEDVQTVSVDGLDVYFTHQETPPRRNATLWDPKVRGHLLIDRAEFLKVALAPRVKTAIIDVRSKEEYFNRGSEEYETPDLQALQINWSEFFSEDGRPKKSIRSQLVSTGVALDDQVIVIDSNGTRSSAAAYALTALGFKNVRNFIGGWNSLVKNKAVPDAPPPVKRVKPMRPKKNRK